MKVISVLSFLWLACPMVNAQTVTCPSFPGPKLAAVANCTNHYIFGSIPYEQNCRMLVSQYENLLATYKSKLATANTNSMVCFDRSPGPAASTPAVNPVLRYETAGPVVGCPIPPKVELDAWVNCRKLNPSENPNNYDRMCRKLFERYIILYTQFEDIMSKSPMVEKCRGFAFQWIKVFW